MRLVFTGLAGFFAVASVLLGLGLSYQAYRSFSYRQTQPADTNDMVAVIVWSATVIALGLAALGAAALVIGWQ